MLSKNEEHAKAEMFTHRDQHRVPSQDPALGNDLQSEDGVNSWR
jgi:hypothetical protein